MWQVFRYLVCIELGDVNDDVEFSKKLAEPLFQ